ncbi:unnamed protein product [Rotaria magnacalcarata]|nr:unnamed protein product [Rotaria magnacalcarata]
MAPPPPYASEKLDHYQQAPPPPPMSMTQPVYIGAPIAIVGDYPMQCTCSQCRRQIVTRTEKKSGLLVWISCGVLFVFGFWVCCFIPFCIDACKDTEHYCPSCNAMLGISKKLLDTLIMLDQNEILILTLIPNI